MAKRDDNPLSAYFRDVSAIPLLTPEEEEHIARGLRAAADRIRVATLRFPPVAKMVVEVWKQALATNETPRFFDFEGDARPIVDQIATLLRRSTKKPRTALSELGEQLRPDDQLILRLSRRLRDVSRSLKGLTRAEAKDLERTNKLSAAGILQLGAELDAAHREYLDYKSQLVNANQRLVITIANKHTGRGLALGDLIQEGNLGLIRAAEKFDIERGVRFYTYAARWIRAVMVRAIEDRSATIRVPQHMTTIAKRIRRVARAYWHQYGRDATSEEISKRAKVPLDKVEAVLKIPKEPLSMETPVGEEGETGLGSLIEDPSAIAPEDAAVAKEMADEIRASLESLPDREARIIRLRFGIDEDRPHTLEEISEMFSLSKERIRQLVAQALRKLRKRSRAKVLAAFMES